MAGNDGAAASGVLGAKPAGCARWCAAMVVLLIAAAAKKAKIVTAANGGKQAEQAR